MNKKKIIIIGAGPGGLAAGMLLGHRGHEVHIYEKHGQPGGRTGEIKLGDYRFDIGPTFFMMKYILDEIFAETGRKSEDYMDFIRLEPMYKLLFKDQEIFAYQDPEKMKAEIKRVFPGNEDGVEKFYTREKKRFEKLMPILQADNLSMMDALRWRFLGALRWFSIGRSIFEEMGKYFEKAEARLTFTFQSKYLGMSPWECPGAFGLVPYVEHEFGIYHIQGGLSESARQMAKVCEEEGVKIHYNTPVRQLTLDGRTVTGVELEDGSKEAADRVVVNADFAYAMNNLVPDGTLRKWSKENLEKKGYSCSIFMLYLGVDKQYDLDHHTIAFAKDYRTNVDDIFGGKLTEEDISFYVCNRTLTDKDSAPEGKSALYVLVPVPNTKSGIDFITNKNSIRRWTIDGMKERMGLTDIEEHIEEELIIGPDEWESDYNVQFGAVFNLAHYLNQMLWFRPRNKFEELDNLYLVGGGTHPGSGLPTIYESGRIAANLIEKE